ncbi:uncharacterized protein B0H18DRAFT_1209929 [Fomitopsis serialis]|uniref:uncharacterized protein n=1 Tax=Fomitopsis serialis TaxID=139415 RepID=UPI002008AA8B|nr:uncharacterized protein B0H18DRAFT_1209929 [Neoantrodia serialis]KAH9929176.1 hypothetical protein B0H18DRAFT_1209929 [Neoantrodia serialis]
MQTLIALNATNNTQTTRPARRYKYGRPPRRINTAAPTLSSPHQRSLAPRLSLSLLLFSSSLSYSLAMRFLKLFAEVSVGVGTLLSGHCPEDGTPPPFKPPLGVDKACAVWGKTADAFFNPVGFVHTLLSIKDSSLNTGWDGTFTRTWRSGQLAPSDEDWSSGLSFVNALPEARKTPSGYTGTTDIILAPCIICSSLRDAPSPTNDDHATIAAGDIRVKFIREWPANSKSAEDMLRTVMLLSLIIGVHILAAMIAHDPHNVVEAQVFPFIGRCFTRLFPSIANGQTIPWDSNGKIFVTTKDGKWMSLVVISAAKYAMVEGSPDEDLKPEMADVKPAHAWSRNARASTSGHRQSGRGQKKASKSRRARSGAPEPPHRSSSLNLSVSIFL